MPDIEMDPFSLFGDVGRAAEDSCPRCENVVVPGELTQAVPIGDGKTVSVRVPSLSCSGCGYSVVTSDAEAIRDAAVRLHRGLLSPEQIKNVRTALGFSRREFSEAFGVPEASMERWENGRLIQNRSADTLLRILANRGIASASDRRRMASGSPREPSVVAFRTIAKSDVSLTDAARRAANFKIRRM